MRLAVTPAGVCEASGHGYRFPGAFPGNRDSVGWRTATAISPPARWFERSFRWHPARRRVRPRRHVCAEVCLRPDDWKPVGGLPVLRNSTRWRPIPAGSCN